MRSEKTNIWYEENQRLGRQISEGLLEITRLREMLQSLNDRLMYYVEGDKVLKATQIEAFDAIDTTLVRIANKLAIGVDSAET